MEDFPDNLTLLCRACLNEGPPDRMYPLEPVALAKFNDCSSLQLTLPQDDFPDKLCMQCLVKCEEFHNFRQMCLRSDEKLKSLVPKTIMEFVEEEPSQQQPNIIEVLEEVVEDDLHLTETPGELIEPLEEDEETHQPVKLTTGPEVPVSVTCPLCQFTDYWSEDFHDHLLSHVEINEGAGYLRICPICEQDDLTGDDDMVMHLYEHMDSRFSCEFCSETFQYPSDWISHSGTGCPMDPCKTKFCCSLCPREFDSQRSLSRHESKHRNHPQGDFECDLCGRKMKDKVVLVRHRKRHMAERQFKCHLCDQSFVYPSELTQHISSHDPENYKFECNFCDPPRRYFLKRSLDGHVKRNHTSRERDQECSECSKRFFDFSALKKHMAIHNAEKRYECDVCQQKFGRNDHLKSHMRTHNRGD